MPAPQDLASFDVPVQAIALDAADELATMTCAFWAKRCWSSFSPPPATRVEPTPSLACALERDGGLACWGLYETSLLGSPVEVVRPGSSGRGRRLAVGRSEVCVVGDDGALECRAYAWNAPERAFVFAPPARRDGRFREVVAGGDRLCALGDDGEVRCWVSHTSCDNRAEDTKPRPVALDCGAPPTATVIEGAGPADTVSASWLGGCAVRRDAKLACWGENGPAAGSSGSAELLTQVSGVTAVSASNTHACALRRDGSVWCWPALRGLAAVGATSRDLARLVTTTPARALATLDGLTCLVDTHGDAACKSGSGALAPLAPAVAELALGKQLCARHEDGHVRCWAESVVLQPRRGDVLVHAAATLFGGGGATQLGRRATAASELGLRAQLDLGVADGKVELTRAVAAVAELRSRDVSTREAALGLGGGVAPFGAGDPIFWGALLAGYAWRPRLDEPLVTLLARLAVRQPQEGRAGHFFYAPLLAFYLASRYGWRSQRVELTFGLEVDLGFPSVVAAAP